MQRRLRLRTVLLGVNLLIFVLPLAGLAALRVYDNQLVRQTESELISQGAFVAASFKDALLRQLAQRAVLASALPYGTPVQAQPPSSGPNSFHPIAAKLDLAQDNIRPPAEPAIGPAPAADPIAVAVGEQLSPTLRAAQELTLAGIRVVDSSGIVVATTREELGLSLAHREEVDRALKGEFVSLVRRRVLDGPFPPLESLSRGTGLRVFVAMPVLDGDRVLGAVILSRTPMTLGKAFYQDRFTLVMGVAVLLAVVLAVSLLTAMTIVRPLRALLRQTEAIAEGKMNAAQPLRRPVTEEVALLSQAFTRMANALNERADYIRAFAASVSHEFKTPLTAIRGTVELLRDHLGEMSEEQRARFLRNLAEDADRLDRLVRRLLELARADVLKPGGERASVPELLARVGDRFRSEGLSVDIEHGRGVETVRMAPEILESILGNLLENARQHVGSQARVSIRTRSMAPGGVEILVSDDGPGISAANAARIFEPFFTTSRHKGGTGLGLTIVRSLVDAHGGSVELLPSPSGSVFRVRVRGGLETRLSEK